MSAVKVLDCTLRDGGQSIEANVKKGKACIPFSCSVIEHITKHLIKSGIEFMELGCLAEIPQKANQQFAIYETLETLSHTALREMREHSKYAAMIFGPDMEFANIPVWNEESCKNIRMVLRYSELKKSLEMCRIFAEQGFDVFIQPQLTMRYLEDELKYIANVANEIQAKALYIVDSYGYMTFEDIRRIFSVYDRELDEKIFVGFHAHNNMGMAYANARSFATFATTRVRIIDSCLMGFGLGAGNLQTELLVPFLKEQGANYNVDEIFEACEEVEKLGTQASWGYSLVNLIPAIYKTAYRYGPVFRNEYNLSYADMNRIISNPDVPYEWRQRYTPEYAKRMIEMGGI